MRSIGGWIALAAALAAIAAVPAQAQQARKWVEPDGRVIYSDVQPSKTARLAGSVRADSGGGNTAEKIEAGKVDFIEGPVTVTAAGGGGARRMVVGSMLHEGDSVVTGDKGELHAEMADGGVIAIRPNSQLTVVRYRARGQSSDASVFNLLRGSFRSITGFIAKASPNAYEVRTPIATIGVRGTDHEPMVVPAGSRDAQPGVYDRVHSGSTSITANNGGSVTVAAGQAGFAPSGVGAARPTVLAAVPAAFRGSASDSRMQGRHATVQQGLNDRRAQAAAGQGMQRGGQGPGPGSGAGSQMPGKGGPGAGGAGGPGRSKGGPGAGGAGAQGQGKGGPEGQAPGASGQGGVGTPGTPVPAGGGVPGVPGAVGPAAPSGVPAGASPGTGGVPGVPGVAPVGAPVGAPSGGAPGGAPAGGGKK